MRLLPACLLLAACSVARAQVDSTPFAFSTLAGRGGTSGAVDGSRDAARFNRPFAVAVDSTGNVLVSEALAHTIRRIAPDGTVTTLAGLAFNPGNVDAVGSAARLGGTSTSSLPQTNTASTGPFGIGATDAGDGYFADAHYHTIRRVTAAGAVSTFVGLAGQGGSRDGTGSGAYFNFPLGVAVDRAGVIYVADTFNHVIRRVTPAGVVTTIAGLAAFWGTGDGIGSGARFLHPTAIAVSPSSGHVYVGDSANTIRRISRVGTTDSWQVTTIAGAPLTYGTTDGVGAAARFGGPPAVGSLSASTVRFSGFSPNAGPTVVSPTISGTGTSYAIGDIAGLAVDANDTVYVADYSNNTIRRVTATGVVTTLGGSSQERGTADGIGGAARFYGPSGLALDGFGRLYIADSSNQTIRVGAPVAPPVIQTQPVSQFVSAGASVTLTVIATGSPLPAVQWLRDGVPIAGATDSTLLLPSVQADTAGNYVAQLTNNQGSATSRAASVGLRQAPAIAVQPAPAAHIMGGGTVTLSVTAAGAPAPTYQWFRDGAPIPGATTATLTLLDAMGSAAGSYTVRIENSEGVVVSNATVVSVDTGRLANLSIRTTLGAADVLIVGFAATGPKPLLVRAVGPTLRDFGVAAAMPDPQLSVYSGATLVTLNDNWAAADAAALARAAAGVGAFPLVAGSQDAALLVTSENAMTAQAVARGGAGIVLVELYDSAPAVAARLTNVSARARVGTGDDAMFAGFVLAGNSSRTLLIRAIGPTLASFGVAGALADPRLDIFRTGEPAALAGNDNWSGDPALSAAFGSVGAFPLQSAASRDAALRVTLAPGVYSARITGVGNTTGEALVEIYELADTQSSAAAHKL